MNEDQELNTTEATEATEATSSVETTPEAPKSDTGVTAADAFIADTEVFIEDLIGNELSESKKEILKKAFSFAPQVIGYALPLIEEKEGSEKVTSIMDGLDASVKALQYGFKAEQNFAQLFHKKAA